MLLEGGDGVERELGVGGEEGGGARDHHGAQGLVGFEVGLCEGVGDGEDVGLEVFGVGY